MITLTYVKFMMSKPIENLSRGERWHLVSSFVLDVTIWIVGFVTLVKGVVS